MTLDKELIMKQLNEYFEYIKTIYINEFNEVNLSTSSVSGSRSK